MRILESIFPPRIYVESLKAAANLVLDGTCMIGLLPMMFTDRALLQSFPLTTIQLVPVVAAGHPLAAIAGPIATTCVRKCRRTIESGAERQIRRRIAVSGSSSVLAAYVCGIGSNDFAFKIDSDVAVYLDGVHLGPSVGAN